MGTALVTGASRGIGRAIARELGRQGHHVVVNYRQAEADARATLQEVEAAGGTASLLPFDVTDVGACEAAVADCLARHGGLDVLVNNAGIRNDMLMVWMEPSDWTSVIDADLNSFFNVTRFVVKEMVLRRSGRIVTIASTSGQSGMPGQTNYAAAKAGVIGASKSLAREVAKRGVTVNVVAPGFIETEMLEGVDTDRITSTIPMNRLGSPEEVAAAVGFLCSPGAGYITGCVINVNGGIYT